mmetsp:Transcript_26289/g.86239  ORF Transcript_26289/g.86239 Transcript_26289/m.86239 type:complete len:242 (-) Transcript_26289:323-1048(-)
MGDSAGARGRACFSAAGRLPCAPPAPAPRPLLLPPPPPPPPRPPSPRPHLPPPLPLPRELPPPPVGGARERIVCCASAARATSSPLSMQPSGDRPADWISSLSPLMESEERSAVPADDSLLGASFDRCASLLGRGVAAAVPALTRARIRLRGSSSSLPAAAGRSAAGLPCAGRAEGSSSESTSGRLTWLASPAAADPAAPAAGAAPAEAGGAGAGAAGAGTVPSASSAHLTMPHPLPRHRQ